MEFSRRSMIYDRLSSGLLKGSKEFLVASVRRLIDERWLPEVSTKTHWINVVPIKVNVHAWKVRHWHAMSSKSTTGGYSQLHSGPTRVGFSSHHPYRRPGTEDEPSSISSVLCYSLQNLSLSEGSVLPRVVMCIGWTNGETCTGSRVL
ncbi:hypothetical protein Tco_0236525 [Tanacetum coccineum]